MSIPTPIPSSAGVYSWPGPIPSNVRICNCVNGLQNGRCCMDTNVSDNLLTTAPSASSVFIPPDVCAWTGHDYFVHPEDADRIICRKCGRSRPIYSTTGDD